MATIRTYTTIEQSRKLAEILPIESADMWWLYITAQGKYIAMMHEEPDPHYLARMESYGIKDAAIRCWSLAALLGVLPKYEIYNNGETIQLDVNLEALATEGDETLLDLVVNMIIHLHELNLL